MIVVSICLLALLWIVCLTVKAFRQNDKISDTSDFQLREISSATNRKQSQTDEKQQEAVEEDKSAAENNDFTERRRRESSYRKNKVVPFDPKMLDEPIREKVALS